jgi:hypothetical protein
MNQKNEQNKYDKAIQYLTENPEQIHDAWVNPGRHVAGCLFQWLAPTGRFAECPTMVKAGGHSFEHKMDEFVHEMDIPTDVGAIRLEHLPLFKQIQEKADEVYNRS